METSLLASTATRESSSLLKIRCQESSVDKTGVGGVGEIIKPFEGLKAPGKFAKTSLQKCNLLSLWFLVVCRPASGKMGM